MRQFLFFGIKFIYNKLKLFVMRIITTVGLFIYYLPMLIRKLKK